MQKIILFVFLLVNLPLLLSANDEELRIKYGVYADYSLNAHFADFRKIPDCPSCSPGYKSGLGAGLGGGLVVDFPLSNVFTFSLRADYYNLNGLLKSTEGTTLIMGGKAVAGEFEHSIDANLGSLGLKPTLKINPFGNFYLNLGAHGGYLLMKDYSQIERITKPTDAATFLDKDGKDTEKRTRNEFSGTLKDATKLYLSVFGGISYEFRLGDNFILEPEISYFFGLSDIVDSPTVPKWQVQSFQAGIALKYSPKIKPKVIEGYKKEIIIDTVIVPSDVFAFKNFSTGKEYSKIRTEKSELTITTIETISRVDTVFIEKKYKLDGTITAFGVDKDGIEIPNPIFKIEEFVSNRLDPLLNYVFFEDNSSDFREVYKYLQPEETSKFRVENLFMETTMDIYYNMLNIIGERLTKYPTANITLVGCNSNIGVEKGNTNLSQKRAETVRDYLVNNWKIAANRIKIESRNLSEKASTPIDEPDKTAENRRVEIYSDDYRIIEPVFIEKIDRTANPPIVRFKATATAEAGLKSWQITATQSSDSKNKFVESGANEIPTKVDWALEEFQKIIPKSPEPIVYNLDLVDNKGNKKSIENQTLPIEVITLKSKRINRVGDYEIEKFSLILFDFDKSTVESANQRIVDFISKRIKKESILEISGFTDRTGNADYNRKLSGRRADATKNALKRADATVQGVGEDTLLYNNDVPEGRFYCRTVQIIVKTPVE
jgi:outer membrane protein OmpA-like peptidoglycan-associated protein